MKYFIILTAVLATCKSVPVSNQSQNSPELESNEMADSYVVNKLLYFDSLINESKIDSKYHTMLANRIETNTSYMEQLTKINSTGRADHYGRKNVSLDTYVAWVNWYLRNKQKLLWDKNKQEAVIN